MQGDGPPVHEAEPPYSLGEVIASCDDNADVLGALAYSRGRNRDIPKSELAPWRQVGPDLLWAASRQTEAEIHRIGPVVARWVANLAWVRKAKLSDLQIELAVADALDRVIYGNCTNCDVSALMVACRKDTFLNLRAEAVGFMAFAMALAEEAFSAQLRELRTP
jgi:hypothetical protein